MTAPTTGPVSTVEVLGTRPRTGILSYLVFPAVMTGCVAIAATMLASGIAPKYVNPAIVPPLFVLMTLLERLHPYRPEWNESRGDLRVDVCYFFVTSFTVMLTTVTLGYVL